ncbi:putative transport protein, chloride channel [Halogeometricum pallidum JCM 14848]|uniref:Putative transport protein, chloride channel n=1 Tax=Halogeometricum pallidum JCM 14848 TaxID=1227487 RepID=M0D5E7_HALPD|nr:chloride channel protein [Halogeometricum pallidum]ELZ29389.1 putative transport protein, chloride channel [Halogeometricum pallidum JCM 14848]
MTVDESNHHCRRITISLAIRNLFGVLLVAVCLAAVVGFVTGAFLRVLYWLTSLLWETVPETITVFPGHPLYTIFVCTVGGLTLGLGRIHLGDHPGNVEELLSEIRDGRTVSRDEISKGAVNSLVSLVFGASLGPELALMAIGGGLSSHALTRLKPAIRTTWTATVSETSASLQSLVSPSAEPLTHSVGRDDVPPVPRWWRWVPGIAAIAVGLVTLKVAAGSGLSFGYAVPEFRSSDPTQRLIGAVLFGTVGGLVSVLYLELRRRLQTRGGENNRLMRSTVGGLTLGCAGAVAPGILFSGQGAVESLFGGLPLGAGALLAAGFAKILMVSVMLETGWKGGPIFPLLAGGAAIGAALAQVIPGVGTVVGLTATMAGVPTGELPRPLVLAGSVALFFSSSLFVVAAIGAVAGTLIVRVVRMMR